MPNTAISHLLDLSSNDFGQWLYDIDPDWRWNWLHLQRIRWHLRSLTDGRINRLMLFLPPRHGKTEMTTIRYSAWRLERDPSRRVIIGAYNQTIANKFSRKIRKIAMTRRVPIDPKRTASEEWETLDGGGLRAVGVGAGITGMGGDLIVIDDPVKNREEANSITYRDRVWQWYTDDLYTRLEPGGQMILIMTRWHEDDLAGRILASEDATNWHVVSLPAIAESDDMLGREIGDALCSDRYDLEALNSIKTAIGSRAFAALYQQRPIEQEGGMFKRSWFKFVDAAPGGRTVRYWDKGATAGGGDPTSGVKMSENNGRYFVENVISGQWGTNERDDVMLQAAHMDGHSVVLWIEQEPGSSGKDAFTYLAQKFSGYALHPDKVTGSKEIRVEPYAAQCEAGNVYLVRGSWNAAYIDQLCSFPNGAHDDMVDGSSGAFSKLAGTGSLLAW